MKNLRDICKTMLQVPKFHPISRRFHLFIEPLLKMALSLKMVQDISSIAVQNDFTVS